MQGPGELSHDQLIRDLKTLRRKVSELEVVNAALRRSVESLLNRESRCALAMAAARTGIWEFDLETGRVVIDVSLGQILGLQTDDSGFDVEQLQGMLPESEKEKLRIQRDMLVSGKTDIIQEEILVETGSFGARWLSIAGSLALNGSGNPSRMVGICRDITSTKESGQTGSENTGS
jgi:PAS domain-containing protein